MKLKNTEKKDKNWPVSTLGDSCTIIMGQSPPSETYNFDKRGLPFFQGKAEFTDLHPIVEKFCSTPGKVAEINDILLSVRAPVGITNIANVKCCIGRGLAALRYPNYKYLFYFLRSKSQELDSKGTGTTFKSISGEVLRSTAFPVPSEYEQKNIVSKIEELFSELDKGIENLKTAQAQLKTYRQSVLKWAFEGKLTNENVKEGELPQNWKARKLAEIAHAIDPQPSHRTPPVVSAGIPYVSIKDFDPEQDKIEFSKARMVSTEILAEHINRYKLENGDFVIGKIGTIGKPVRIVLPQDYALSANIVLIQPRKVEATYLYYFFQSNLVENAFTAGMKATTQAAFGIQKVRELTIHLPNEAEQMMVVAEIEKRLSVTNKMEESINESLLQSESLRQSILKKAFEGELTY